MSDENSSSHFIDRHYANEEKLALWNEPRDKEPLPASSRGRSDAKRLHAQVIADDLGKYQA